MKFCRLVGYDIKNGIIRKWYFYLTAFFLFIIYSGAFFM